MYDDYQFCHLLEDKMLCITIQNTKEFLAKEEDQSNKSYIENIISHLKNRQDYLRSKYDRIGCECDVYYKDLNLCKPK